MGLEHKYNSEPTLEYTPTEEDIKRLDFIAQILQQAKALGINFSIFGGYGLDGLYGKLTRRHDDLDMFVNDESYEAAKDIIIQAGGQLVSEDEVKVVFIFSELKDFKVEFAKTSVLSRFTDQNKVDFVPEEENASLGNIQFRAPNLAGQKIIIEIEGKRGEENGWIYSDEKLTNRDLIISSLEKKD